MRSFIYVDQMVQVTRVAPVGCTLTTDLKDILDDLNNDVMEKGYALVCNDLGAVRDVLEDDAALRELGIDDDYTEAVESLHSALSRPELYAEQG